MSEETKQSPNTLLTIIGLVIGLFLMSWLVGGLGDGESSIGSARALERKETLEEARQVSMEQLANFGVVNEVNEIYQVPIDRAMEMMVAEWQDAEEGREKLLARSGKAFFVPAAPQVEAPPSIYE